MAKVRRSKRRKPECLRIRVLRQNFCSRYQEAYPHLYQQHFNSPTPRRRQILNPIEIARKRLELIHIATPDVTGNSTRNQTASPPPPVENNGHINIFNYRTLVSIFVRRFRFFERSQWRISVVSWTVQIKSIC